MAFMQWTDDYSVKVSEIDQQHQRLIALINDLFEAMQQGKGKDVLGNILNGLMAYTGTHFKTEEKYFDQFGYPETAAHKKEHANFVAKVMEFKKAFDAGQSGLSLNVMNFLNGWLVNHIQNIDKRYGPFFNEKGLN
jgi:hemerythrin